MFRRSLSILAAMIATATVCVANVSAQPPGTLGPAHAVTLASIKGAIIKGTGAESATIELSTTARTFTVKVVNGKFADGTSAGRENEAGAIETIVANAITAKPEFKDVVVIIVEYVKRRNGGSARVVDSIEFRKDTSGAFRHHITWIAKSHQAIAVRRSNQLTGRS
jgi:hypothetical protein